MSGPAVTERTVVHSGIVDDSAPARAEAAQVRIGLGRALSALSLLALWFVVYLLVFSSLEQDHAQHQLYGQLRTQLAEGTAPTGAPIVMGAPVALLDIESLDLASVVVVEGTRGRQLQDGPGHRSGSVLPGQVGVSVIAGRSVSFGAPFRGLSQIRPGASVVLTTAQGRFSYTVIDVREDGDPAPPPPAVGSSRLTLITAAGAGSRLSRLQPTHSVYVDAELAEGVAAGPRSTPDPEPELLAAQVDRAGLAELALALLLLIAVLGGFVWSWHRWAWLGTWIAGVPAVLAALWLVSSVAARFLPALL